MLLLLSIFLNLAWLFIYLSREFI